MPAQRQRRGVKLREGKHNRSFLNYSDREWRRCVTGKLNLLRVLDVVNSYSMDEIMWLINSRYITCGIPPKCHASSLISLLWNLQTLVFSGPISLSSVVWELRHLRHLKMPEITLADPRDDDNVVELENLQIPVFSGPISLPSEFWQMSQLRHLKMPEITLADPPDDDNVVELENLQTLSIVKDFIFSKNVVRRMPNLKKLGIDCTEIIGSLCLSNLAFLLKSLVLKCRGTWENMAFPDSLKKLTLSCCLIPWEDMSVVGSLPNLEVLKLRECAARGSTWKPNAGEFCQLKFLLIEWCELEIWEADESNFPSLEHLQLVGVRMEEFPMDFAQIETLRTIDLRYCSKSLFLSANNMSQNRENSGCEAIQIQSFPKEEREKMAKAAVKFLLENVKNLVNCQVDLIISYVKNLVNYQVDLISSEAELKKLQRMLEMMEAVLKDLAEMQAKGHTITELERQIRWAVYDAEDTIDTFIMHRSNDRRSISYVAQCLWRSKTLSFAKTVKELREEQLWPLYDKAVLSLAGLPWRDVSSDDDNRLQKIKREENVVGFTDQEAILIKYLKEEIGELDVISIMGMPGLGKTTLASKIFHHPKIQFEFPTLIWVYVSQEFNVKDAFLTILKKFTHENMSSRSVEKLAQEVRSRLSQGRFLLFMDDVWTVQDWEMIKAALPKTNKSGKVLITSRHERVAVQANPKRDPHKLRFLTFDESWELLQKEVFGRNNSCPQELEGPGMLIARKCGGVPLAVVVMGGILVEECSQREDLWKQVSNSVSTYIQNDVQRQMENIIYLSYNKLPEDLRDCFLYLGVFAEDSEIPAWKLTRLWIAEGFIKQNHGIRSLEEAAEDNLNDLVVRNLVMVEKTKANGDVKTCRVHDMIREFCKGQAGLDNRNLFQEVKMTREGEFHPVISQIGKCRRLSIHSHVVEFLNKIAEGKKVRSFLCFSKETVNLPTECIPAIPETFELLRVIDASPIKFTKFPPKLTRLIHLRYITLSGNELKALPKDASKLWNLQTVRIDTMASEFEIKADIGKMKQLRHLKTKAAIVLKEVQGDGGENLQTLSRLSTKSCTEQVFSRAKNLKNLGIRGDLATIVDKILLERLERLKKLKLVHDTFSANKPAGSALQRLPPKYNFPPYMRILTLSSTHLDWPHMATLGDLHKLEVLKLKEMAFKGRRWEAEGRGFRCLESLHIARTDLEIWTIASGDPFPKLKNLVLKNCERLQQIPSQLGKSLQFVELERVTKPLVESAKKIKEASQQMQGGSGGRRGGFKLIISPEDALATTSS